MAVDYIYKVHSIEYVPLTDPVTPPLSGDPDLTPTVAALTSVSMPVQANVTREVQAGDIFATSGRIEFTSVDLSFTTNMAQKLLQIVGIDGLCMDPLVGHLNVYVARYECNGPSAGAVHRRYTITKGLFFLQSINTEHQGDATVSAQIRAVYEDGGGDPVSVTDNVALPNATQIGDLSGRWTLHEGTHNSVNGNAVSRKRSLNIDFGVSTSTQGADSDTFDSFASIDSVLPVVTVQGVDPRWFDTLGLTIDGKAVTHANTSFILRKRDGAGGFIADNVTDAHIRIRANGPAYYDQLLNGNSTDAATMSFRVEAIQAANGDTPLMIDPLYPTA